MGWFRKMTDQAMINRCDMMPARIRNRSGFYYGTVIVFKDMWRMVRFPAIADVGTLGG